MGKNDYVANFVNFLDTAPPDAPWCFWYGCTDPRMDGRGHVFDNCTPTNGDGFYEKFMRGEKVNAGWVNQADFEKQPVPSTRP